MLGFDEIDIGMEFEKSRVKVKEVSNKEIAIIGISAKLPSANSMDEFWRNLVDGVDCVRQLPEVRKKDADKYFNFIGTPKEDILYCESGYLNEIDKFDYGYFKLSPKEASLMDPNQRIFLETACEAIEDGGYGGKKLIGSRTGVYVGYSKITSNTYLSIINEVEPSSAIIGLAGNVPAIIASRIGYIMDFRGPSILVDTTCSSSLVALHLACQGLRNGECDYAIAGCSKIDFLPIEDKQKIGIESSDNRTKAFDDSSDGTGTGEGVIAILLKPLNKALKDRDNIYAVIKGSAMNQDGASIGITAPNSVAQEDVIVKAWEDARINPETISYIEAHGTGTELGDPIEIDGLNRAFKKYTSKKQFCAISALKTNIGHLDSGSGLAGAVKAILAIKNGIIPPILHFKMPNRKIGFELSPVYINDMAKRWESFDSPRRCGVSSFGLSGTNCHVVLEEAVVDHSMTKGKDDAGCEILTISARTENALNNLIRKYIEMLESENSPDLGDVCYTANTGRGHYDIRIAIMAEDKNSILKTLKNIYGNLETAKTGENLFFGKCKSASTLSGYSPDELGNVMKLIGTGIHDVSLLRRVCELYINGEDVDWDLLYAGSGRRRVKLPTYPFERTRCWIDIPDTSHLNLNRLITKELNCFENVPEELIEDINQVIKKWADKLNENGCQVKTRATQEIILKGRENNTYTELEKVVGQVWGEILGYKELNICENFYEYGGDSIIAMKIVNQLSSRLNEKIELADLFSTITIEKMAARISQRFCSLDGEKNKFLIVPKAEDMEYYPLSSAQKRMFVSHVMEGANTSYNIFGAFDIKGNIDIERLEKAINKLVERHEALRTSFELVKGIAVQKIHEGITVKIELKDILEENIMYEIASFIKPFDLGAAPLLRVALFKYGKERHVLVYDMNHIISDGVSMDIFASEFMELYREETLPDIKIQYKDFAVWQNKFLESEEIKKQEEYWINTFKGEIPVLKLPTDFNRTVETSYKGDRVDTVITKELQHKLKNIALNCKTTLYNVLLAAYNILLFKYTNQEDIIIGSPVAGRQNVQLESIIGMFVNMLAMRNYPTGDKRFCDFLNEVNLNSLKAFENQDYQFEKLVEKIGLAGSSNGGVLFNTVFALQNMGMKALEMEGLNINVINFKAENIPFPLMLVGLETKDGINFTFEYQTSLFKKNSVEDFARNYCDILSQIAEKEDIIISDINISSSFIKADFIKTDKSDFDFDF